MANKNLFKYFKTSPEIIRLAVMFYVQYPLSYRQVEDILHERGIDICHETVRFWVGRFGLKFAGEIRKKRAGHHSNWQLEPSPQGLKIQIYCFTNTTEWSQYEGIKSDILEHILAILPEFDLFVFQDVGSNDVKGKTDKEISLIG